jgi:RNA recognition motif-containing protein
LIIFICISILLEHLCEYFAKFGNVESATVKFDKSGRSKGFGFVLFEDRDSTDKVIQQQQKKSSPIKNSLI